MAKDLSCCLENMSKNPLQKIYFILSFTLIVSACHSSNYKDPEIHEGSPDIVSTESPLNPSRESFDTPEETLNSSDLPKIETTKEELGKKLVKASENGDLTAVKQLISEGADIEFYDRIKIETPLGAAVRYGHEEVWEFFLEQGVDIYKLKEQRLSPFVAILGAHSRRTFFPSTALKQIDRFIHAKTNPFFLDGQVLKTVADLSKPSLNEIVNEEAKHLKARIAKYTNAFKQSTTRYERTFEDGTKETRQVQFSKRFLPPYGWYVNLTSSSGVTLSFPNPVEAQLIVYLLTVGAEMPIDLGSVECGRHATCRQLKFPRYEATVTVYDSTLDNIERFFN